MVRGELAHVPRFPARADKVNEGRRLIRYKRRKWRSHSMPKRSSVRALLAIGFDLSSETQAEIVRGKDFVQLKNGPFDLDLVFAPDGIESFAEAQARAVREGIFPVANIRDIIASKRASGRMKDRLDLHLLERFKLESPADSLRFAV